jgi:hypothetical protein
VDVNVDAINEEVSSLLGEVADEFNRVMGMQGGSRSSRARARPPRSTAG